MSRRFMFAAAVLVLVVLLATAASAAVTVLWQEGFETYNTDAGKIWGGLDKNKSGSPNAAANGTGNPWFGPSPNNGWVTKATANPAPMVETVTPHSGNFMMRGGRSSSSWYNGYDGDIDQVNIAYRFNQGQAFKSNFSVDWWFYDILGNTYPGDVDKGPGNFGDYVSLEYRPNAPTNTDYVNSGTLAAATASISLGSIEDGTGYNTSVYQANINNTLVNSNITRTKGWHNAAISIDKDGIATLSIDGTIIVTQDSGSANGFNVFTSRTCWSTPDTWNQSAYLDDITLAKIPEPGSMLAMASGLIALLGFAKRRRS